MSLEQLLQQRRAQGVWVSVFLQIIPHGLACSMTGAGRGQEGEEGIQPGRSWNWCAKLQRPEAPKRGGVRVRADHEAGKQEQKNRESRVKVTRKWREAGEEGVGTVEASVFMFSWAQKWREAVKADKPAAAELREKLKEQGPWTCGQRQSPDYDAGVASIKDFAPLPKIGGTDHLFN